jgi:Inorganic pyrophosphatase
MVSVTSAVSPTYGFVIGTTAQDGCNLDCYVITRHDIRTATIMKCEPVGLMEQFEDGIEDHNILAVPAKAHIGRRLTRLTFTSRSNRSQLRARSRRIAATGARITSTVMASNRTL